MARRTMEKWARDLPSWASYGVDHRGEDRVDVDPDIIYPKFLGIMKEIMPELDIDNPTQEMLRIAYFLFHRRLKKLMYEDGKDFIRVHILKRPAWAEKNFPVGEPIDKTVFYKKLGLDKIKQDPEPGNVDWD